MSAECHGTPLVFQLSATEWSRHTQLTSAALASCTQVQACIQSLCPTYLTNIVQSIDASHSLLVDV